ncbi:ANK1 [Symbiodinium natans]|uniref:ANK1 protein n=1 Tax=Symbiodinium natans TaxID=878477 RepID=A0A812TMR9_9DINO|nr:ANK1 [Symbiodinium natans]
MPMAQFAETTKLQEHPIRFLKEVVGEVRGLPRFRLRLLRHGIEVDDGTVLEGQADLELVQLAFSSASDAEVAELVAAAGDNEVVEVERMLSRPQNPDLGYPPPLLLASLRGHVEVVRTLLEAKADCDKEGNGQCPLLAATEDGHVEVVRLLLESRADSNLACTFGSVPLHVAAEHGHATIAHLLLAAGAEADKQNSSGWTPLHWAASGLSGIGHAGVARMLLEARADQNIANSDGDTPLLRAAHSSNYSIFRALLVARRTRQTAVAKLLC